MRMPTLVAAAVAATALLAPAAYAGPTMTYGADGMFGTSTAATTTDGTVTIANASGATHTFTVGDDPVTIPHGDSHTYDVTGVEAVAVDDIPLGVVIDD